jgi:hypothetical protein
MIPHGNLTRYEILTKVYKLKNELEERPDSTTEKYLANEYLNKVLDYINEFTY